MFNMSVCLLTATSVISHICLLQSMFCYMIKYCLMGISCVTMLSFLLRSAPRYVFCPCASSSSRSLIICNEFFLSICFVRWIVSLTINPVSVVCICVFEYNSGYEYINGYTIFGILPQNTF